MDIVKALRELYAEKKRLDATIAALEAHMKAGRAGTKSKGLKRGPGRKSMSAAERKQVSERMRSYWEARRAKAADSNDEKDSAEETEGRAQSNSTTA